MAMLRVGMRMLMRGTNRLIVVLECVNKHCGCMTWVNDFDERIRML
jgi:hypothetical protein